MQERLKYIDALRGFTMFLVVLGHVNAHGMHIWPSSYSYVNTFFISFRMPLFFFISGFIGYKAVECWTPKFYEVRLAKKALVQLLPATIFFILYCYYTSHNPYTYFIKAGPDKYWFTYVLFEFFLVYFSIFFLCNIIKKPNIALIAMLIASMSVIWGCHFFDANNNIVKYLALRNFSNYLFFFSLGLLAKKHIDKVEAILSNDIVITLSIILFTLFFYLDASKEIAKHYHIVKYFDHYFFVKITGLIVVFTFFFRLKDWFARDGKLSKTMQYVGKRTLDIYLIHYFLIPNITVLRPYLVNNQNPLFELSVCSIVAVVIIVLCLIISRIIRMSEFLGHYLFGVKSKKYF